MPELRVSAFPTHALGPFLTARLFSRLLGRPTTCPTIQLGCPAPRPGVPGSFRFSPRVSPHRPPTRAPTARRRLYYGRRHISARGTARRPGTTTRSRRTRGGDARAPGEEGRDPWFLASTLRRSPASTSRRSSCSPSCAPSSATGCRLRRALRVINVYDVEGISEELFERVRAHRVQRAAGRQRVAASCPSRAPRSARAGKRPGHRRAGSRGRDRCSPWSTLPGQFDQRADSASECVQLISQGERPAVRSAKALCHLGRSGPRPPSRPSSTT